jgi:hypothetical protein
VTVPPDHLWANLVIAGARDEEAIKVVKAINRLTVSGECNRGSIITACAQILAQCITGAPPNVAAEVRAGIMGLIDDFAMRLATATSEEKGEPPL